MEKLDYFLRIWGAHANTLREKRELFAGIWGDQCIIFRDKWSTDPLGASFTNINRRTMNLFHGIKETGATLEIPIYEFLHPRGFVEQGNNAGNNGIYFM